MRGARSRQADQRLVERHEVIGAIAAHDGFLVERHMLGRRAPRLRLWRRAWSTRMRRMACADYRQEMGAILPLHALVIDQPHVGFVDQRRRLQAVAGALAPHVVVRQATEFVVDDRRQEGERTLISVAPRAEKRADVARNRFTRRFRPDASCAPHYMGLLPFFA